jgi:hypothetical protein
VKSRSPLFERLGGETGTERRPSEARSARSTGAGVGAGTRARCSAWRRTPRGSRWSAPRLNYRLMTADKTHSFGSATRGRQIHFGLPADGRGQTHRPRRRHWRPPSWLVAHAHARAFTWRWGGNRSPRRTGWSHGRTRPGWLGVVATPMRGLFERGSSRAEKCWVYKVFLGPTPSTPGRQARAIDLRVGARGAVEAGAPTPGTSARG